MDSIVSSVSMVKSSRTRTSLLAAFALHIIGACFWTVVMPRVALARRAGGDEVQLASQGVLAVRRRRQLDQI